MTTGGRWMRSAWERNRVARKIEDGKFYKELNKETKITFKNLHTIINENKDINNYKFPDPFSEGRFDEAKKAVKKYKDKFAIVGDLETSFFETSWYLVGLEKLLFDMRSK